MISKAINFYLYSYFEPVNMHTGKISWHKNSNKIKRVVIFYFYIRYYKLERSCHFGITQTKDDSHLPSTADR